MLPTLHCDLITYISNYLKLQDIVNLKQINKLNLTGNPNPLKQIK